MAQDDAEEIEGENEKSDSNTWRSRLVRSAMHAQLNREATDVDDAPVPVC